MEYHRLKPRFNTAAYDPKRISFVYVLSQNEGKGPYKVGMSKGDLWRRMSNYATAFVDFYVYYLVPVPYADVFAVELAVAIERISTASPITRMVAVCVVGASSRAICG